ncbi:MAG: tyrosine-type recombinase/integrase [Treponema sp.]|jgi:integrase/recombinase XerD|nr:tyrosine-type recombinase/integrase [Treponema sp.]
MVDNQTLLNRYHSRLIALERRASLTAETYCLEIRRFLLWLEKEKLTVNQSGGEAPPERQANFSDFSRYLEHRRDADGIDSRSAAKAISALRSFFRFLVEEHIRDDNCVTLLESPRRGGRLPAVLQEGEADRLLALIDTQTPLGIRNRTLYELIYSAGLRVSEAAALNTRDLFLSEAMARVMGKGRRERLVIFGPDAVFWLRRYLAEVRPALLGRRQSPALFVSRSGKRLSRKGIWKNYAALADQAGVSSKIHTLRHTFATELLSGGADLRSVQELLGHADISTTQVYTHVNDSLLRESHRRYLPRLRELEESP